MIAPKDTGFHPSDADFTRGRGQALSDAESFARRQVGLSRPVTLTPPAALSERAMKGGDA